MKGPAANRRSRSNDGTRNHPENLLPISQRDLARLLIIFGPDAKPEHVARTFHGPKASRGHPPIALSDEQVIAIRKMREWHGMSRKQIADATGVTSERIESVIQWRCRVHLDPGPRPALAPVMAEA